MVDRSDAAEYLGNYLQVRIVYYADQEIDNMFRKITGCGMPEKYSVYIDNGNLF